MTKSPSCLLNASCLLNYFGRIFPPVHLLHPVLLIDSSEYVSNVFICVSLAVNGLIYGGDFAKLCGLSEYMNFNTTLSLLNELNSKSVILMFFCLKAQHVTTILNENFKPSLPWCMGAGHKRRCLKKISRTVGFLTL